MTTEYTSLLSKSTPICSTTANTSMKSSALSHSFQCSHANAATPITTNGTSITTPLPSADTAKLDGIADGSTNYSSNVLMVYRLQNMRANSNTNLLLSFLCLVYLGINVTLICVNYVNSEFEASHPPSEEEDEPIDDTVYHLVEFWATFGFAIVECIALANTPKSLYRDINGDMNPLFLRMVMLFNVLATSVSALMVSFSLETFEILSHEIEYVNELTMSFIDVVLLTSLWNSRKKQAIDTAKLSNITNGKQRQELSPSSSVSPSYSDDNGTNCKAWITTFIALVVATIQLGVYNLMGYDKERHNMVGEPLGHMLEFSFEIISSMIVFWFCMDNKFVADKEIGLILYGSHPIDCQICEGQSTDFARTHSGNPRLSQKLQQPLQYQSSAVAPVLPRYQTV